MTRGTIQGKNALFFVTEDGENAYTIHTPYAVDSVAIRGVNYSSRTERLQVLYRSTSKWYVYENVTADDMMQLMMAPSLGSFIANKIKAEKELVLSFSTYL